METVNLTIKMPEDEAVKFKRFLEEYVEIVDFRILPDTNKMWEEDEAFKLLCKAEKKAKEVKGKYINEHNNKYK